MYWALLPLCFGRVLVLGLYKDDYFQFLVVFPFDYASFVVSGKVTILLTEVTNPVGWLSLIQQTVLGRSTIALQ